MSRLGNYLRQLTDMSYHTDYQGASLTIRNNIAFRGPNVFILACAIIIASVGLNHRRYAYLPGDGSYPWLCLRTGHK